MLGRVVSSDAKHKAHPSIAYYRVSSIVTATRPRGLPYTGGGYFVVHHCADNIVSNEHDVMHKVILNVTHNVMRMVIC